MREFVLKVVICVLGIYFVISIIKPNVMDEIGKRKIYGLSRVSEVRYSGHDESDWVFGLETMGAFGVDYKEEYLREDVSGVSLHFRYDTSSYNEINDFSISIRVILAESDKAEMGLGAHYDYKKKELIYNPVYIVQGEPGNSEVYKDEKSIDELLNRYGLTRKDVQRYQDYAIYGVVVKTWTKAHRESYWLERWKLKSRVVDNTFRFEEE